MRVRKLTNNFDYSFGNSLLDFYIDEPNGVGQSVQTRLLLWLGEWYLDNTIGTPYLEGILGKFSKANADATIQDQVLQTPNVVDIQNYVSTIDVNSRAMSVSFTIDTVYGTTQVQMLDYSLF